MQKGDFLTFNRISKKGIIYLAIIFVFVFVNFAYSESRTPIKFKSSDRILILAAHPDDEVHGTSGIIQHAVSMKVPVKVVYLTEDEMTLKTH